MFKRILLKSILRRKRHIGLALAIVIVGTSVVAALFSVFSNVDVKMSRELRRYGANMVVLPAQPPLAGSPTAESQISEKELKKIAGALNRPQVVAWIPLKYQVVVINGSKQAVLVGTNFENMVRVKPYLRIEGRLPRNTEDRGLLVGVEAARKLGLKIGERVQLGSGSSNLREAQTFQITGLVKSGASEDNRLFANLMPVRKLLKSTSIDVIMASVIGGMQSIEQLRQTIEAVAPRVRVEPVLKIAKSEGQLLNRISALSLIAAFIILTITTIAAMATIQSLITERRMEIGLMKVLGARNISIIALFASEAGIVALTGSLIGYGIGIALAQIIGYSAFGTSIDLNPVVFVTVLAIGFLIAVPGVPFFIKKITKIEPANTLRGEY